MVQSLPFLSAALLAHRRPPHQRVRLLTGLQPQVSPRCAETGGDRCGGAGARQSIAEVQAGSGEKQPETVQTCPAFAEGKDPVQLLKSDFGARAARPRNSQAGIA
jgi:hypothetical protein